MELSDLHHPNCKINRKSSAEIGAARRESESSDSLLLSPEASKATEAVEFIAEHLRNEDQYIQVSFLSLLSFGTHRMNKVLNDNTCESFSNT